MSIKTRLNKLETTAKTLPDVWLKIITEAGDTADVIERLKGEAVEQWKQANPDKAPPREFNWIQIVIVDPPPRSLH
ncbi:hypothetical protein [Methylomicrobium agile]|uniref:hypothetical protein n=1 Tax=Methylomicrobium agile TaxID=39774 RepID=UPI0004DF5317|nr:hypothetical protein [Methylomicrobium agile]